MLDVDRLHDVVLGKLSGRRVGRTTAMLVEAAQLADFCAGAVVILGLTHRRASQLAGEFWRIATELGFRPVRERACLVSIGTKRYHFLTAETRRLGMHPAAVFEDKAE